MKPIPEGYHTITPFIVASGANSLLDFLKHSFGARELSIMRLPDGSIAHADIMIGDSHLMLSEATERYPAMPGMIYLYAEDCDDWYHKAIAAGGISLREPTNEFYGDRSCGVKDASGNQWWIATHIEDVSPEEMKQREEEWKRQQPAAGS